MKTSFDARDHYPDFDLPTSCCPATIIQSAVSRETQERETQAEMRFFPSGLRIFHGLMQQGHPKQTLAEPCLFGDPWPFNQSNYRGVEVSTVVCVEHEPLKVFHDLAGTPIRVKRKDQRPDAPREPAKRPVLVLGYLNILRRPAPDRPCRTCS
jgi:hypothetical protein